MDNNITCQKIPYISRGEANLAQKRIKGARSINGNGRVKPYICGKCGYWHLSSWRNKKIPKEK